MILSSFIKDPSKTHYDGEDKNERIRFILRSSFLVNYKWITLVILMLIAPTFTNSFLKTLEAEELKLIKPSLIAVITMFWYLGTFGLLLAKFLLWYFNVYIISTKKVVDMDFMGLLYKNISEATLDNIEDVTSNISGTFGTIFNIGDVYIQTAAETREFEFKGIYNPAKVRDLISDLVTETRNHLRRHGRGEILLNDD
jgi:hypothetical protein